MFNVIYHQIPGQPVEIEFEDHIPQMVVNPLFPERTESFENFEI